VSWRELLASPDGTHHVRDGRPAYDARFDEVLKFHAPGLAPVSRGGEAWHIDPRGEAVYPRRFRRAFGFYEDRAAVEGEDGWHHIVPSGEDAYGRRFAWCGNFQGGRSTVRAADGLYHHLRPDGSPCYPKRWRYAGDYRDGVAVVQGDDGRSTHIDAAGALLHGQWFTDLDVFHKGHARARDRDGWFHVDARGQALYRHRFAMIEAFYNGQALVERHDGSKLVIGHDGEAIIEIAPPWARGRSWERSPAGRRLLLIGLGAVGKTTVGKELAERWRVPFVSLDDCRRRWGDATVGGDHLARAMFLRACGALDSGVFETSGAGPYRHATRSALAERDAPLLVCWLDAPVEVRDARRRAPPTDIPFPSHAQGAWDEADAVRVIKDDIAKGWWSELPGWSAHRLDANRPPDAIVAEIERLSSTWETP
jgi:hypothetical protein